MTRSTLVPRGAALAVAAALLAAPADARTDIDGGLNLFSREQDVEMGREAAAEAERELPILRDRALEAYVTEVGMRVAEASIEPGYPYRFRVVDSAEINAFALPGGFIYVNRGILDAASDEAELAGVLAHEVAHVAARHGTNQLSKQVLVQMPLALVMGSVLKDEGGWKAGLARLGINLGLSTVFLSYSRNAETQADILATQQLHDAGYDAYGVARFFEKMQGLARREPSRLEGFFASHPSPGDRRARVDRELRELGAPPRAAVAGTAGFERMKRRLADLPSPRGGRGPRLPHEHERDREREHERDDVGRGDERDRRDGRDVARVSLPSERVVRYRSRDDRVRLLVPENWEVHEESDALTAAPREALDRRTGELTHGVVVRFLGRRFDARRDRLEDALDALVRGMVDRNPSLREQRRARRFTTVAGSRALATTLAGRAAYGAGEEVVSVALLPVGGRDGEGLVAVIAVAPRADLRDFDPAFDRVVTSLRVR